MPERDENGKFIKGNGGGPGRLPRKKEDRFMEVSIAAVSLKDWRAIIKKAKDQAILGDQQARKFLADYLLGPPQQKLDVTSGGEPIVFVSWDDVTNNSD
jgi:hypothetical protein